MSSDRPFVSVTDIKPLALERGWDYRMAAPASVQWQEISRTIPEEILDFLEHGEEDIATYCHIHGDKFERRAKHDARLHSVSPYEVPETFTCAIPGAEIVFRDGLVVTAEHEILVQALTQKTAMQAKYFFARSRRNPYTCTSAGRHVSLLCFGADNYWHWLVDGLLRLALFPLGDTSFRVIIPANAPPFVRATLRLLDISEERLVEMDGRKITVDELILAYPEAIAAKPKQAHLLEHRRRLLAAAGVNPAVATSSRLLYISRAHATRRPIVNEAALWPVLRHYGFDIVRCEDLSVDEQITLFAEAKCVVGAHGAGFGNLLFAPPGTILVEIFNRQLWVDCYQKMCGLLGHTHWHIFGETASRENYLTRVDPHKLDQVLSYALR